MRTVEAVVQSATPVAPTRGTWVQRAVPVACGCVLAGAAGVVAWFDPSAEGSRFPACQFHAATGLWCPGCGLTRGFHRLFRGDLAGAVSYNLFVPLVLVAVTVSMWNWLRSSWGASTVQVPAVLQQATVRWLPAALLLYGVLRNIPAPGLRSLAP